MITTPTTFIVGAGASCDYGLRTGPGLFKQAQRLDPNSPVYQLIVQAQIATPVELNATLEDLRQHLAPSLDAFLESRQEEEDEQIRRIGRALIAGLIALDIDATRGAHLFGDPEQPNGDWLAVVIEQMRAGAATWQKFAEGNRSVRFVTFNFDDLIELRLASALRAIYRGRISDGEVGEAMSSFPVIHLHGELPPIPRTSMQYGDWGTHPDWINWLLVASENVRVILDKIEPGLLRSARQAIDDAQVICFLGFAFATENLAGRLGLPMALSGRGGTVSIFGSTTQERDGARHRIVNLFRQVALEVTLGSAIQSCRDVLLDFGVFRD